MTFTEAAVEVLRLVGKPLHYKKITEVAIERNLLSHVGKTPEITMSSRLATMLKRDRGEAPIVKVKPGVFGLKEFSAEVLETAAKASGHQYELPEEPTSAEAASADEALAEPAAEPTETPAKGVKGPGASRLPGADVFPEEEDDDVPILAKLDEPRQEEEDGKGKRKRRRRRRKKGGGADDEAAADVSGARGDGGDGRGGRSRDRGPRAERAARPERGGRGERGRPERTVSEARPVEGDWERAPGQEDLAGRELADAIEAALGAGPRALDYDRIAGLLVRKGRLSGDAQALAPTIAAAVRGDNARRQVASLRPRFRQVDGGVTLIDWDLPDDVVRAERDALRAAERQREAVHRSFLRRLAELPATGFMELVAAWLNAEGVMSLRGVRRGGGGAGVFHLAGTLRRRHEETRVAIVVWRDGTPLGREHLIDVRGALHHYGQASAAWLVTTGRVQSGAREEAAVAGAAPIVLFDGVGLARAMEELGVGLRRTVAPLCTLDLDLLDALRGPGQVQARRRSERSEGDRDRPERGDRERERGRRDPTSAPEAEASAADEETGEASSGEPGESQERGRRRRRRRGRREETEQDTAGASAPETAGTGADREADEAAAAPEGGAVPEGGEEPAAEGTAVEEEPAASASGPVGDPDAPRDSSGVDPSDRPTVPGSEGGSDPDPGELREDGTPGWIGSEPPALNGDGPRGDTARASAAGLSEPDRAGGADEGSSSEADELS